MNSNKLTLCKSVSLSKKFKTQNSVCILNLQTIFLHLLRKQFYEWRLSSTQHHIKYAQNTSRDFILLQSNVRTYICTFIHTPIHMHTYKYALIHCCKLECTATYANILYTNICLDS